jgi:predicted DNA-binding transcriptional regulator YafY
MPDLSDLETVLTWEGAIDNERIRQLLGVKAVWASRLMGELVKRMGARAQRSTAHAPLEYLDRRAPRRSPDEYLRIVSRACVNTTDTIEDARIDLSTVSPLVFATLFQAIKYKTGVAATYRSMSTPGGARRVIFPHAFVRAPRRWHVRAWCMQRESFRDFTLGRMTSATLVDTPSVHQQDADTAWRRFVELVVIAHPGLSAEQQAMIADEYFPGARAMRVRVRECLAPYAIQDLRLALNAEKQTPPNYQLLVNNAEKLSLTFSEEDGQET